MDHFLPHFHKHKLIFSSVFCNLSPKVRVKLSGGREKSEENQRIFICLDMLPCQQINQTKKLKNQLTNFDEKQQN